MTGWTGVAADLCDGDEVSITATAPGPEATTIGLGEVRGRITAET